MTIFQFKWFFLTISQNNKKFDKLNTKKVVYPSKNLTHEWSVLTKSSLLRYSKSVNWTKHVEVILSWGFLRFPCNLEKWNFHDKYTAADTKLD